jgi:intein-encoded DNA endonuclease-like protein
MRKHEKLYRFTLAQETIIIELYLNQKLSINKISKLYNVDRDTITRLLKRNNIELFPLGSHIRKYPLNETYFDNIDSEEKAYFLGFLYADGCNHTNDYSRKKIDISLQEEDKNILIKFSKMLYDNNEFLSYVIGRNKNKPQWCLRVHSKYLSDKLSELGCVSRKSLILTFPEWLIDPVLQRHFIRGYFDGDGCLTRSKRRKIYDYAWSITSTESFCNKIKDIINNNCNVNFRDNFTCPNNNITHTISVRGYHQILRVSNWLYKDATIYLDRKYQKYLELKQGNNIPLIL